MLAWLRWCSFCFLAAVAATLLVFLLLSILLIGMKVPLGAEVPTVVDAVRAIYLHAALPFLGFLGEFLKLTLPWSAAILLLIYLFWRDERFSRWLESVTSLEVSGVKVQRQGSEAVEMFITDLAQADKYVKKLNSELKVLYRTATSYAAELRARFKIDEAIADLAKQVKAEVVTSPIDDYRFTLHIPDFIFEDRLFQLTEYYGGRGEQLTVGKTGRVFSIRYGIIGRVWRSDVPEIEGDVISDDEQALMKENEEDPKDPEHLKKYIARRWGLSIEEAGRIIGQPSYGAVAIQRGGHRLGVVYFDSKRKNVFNREKADDVERIVNASSLVDRLMQMNSALIHVTRIKIYQTESSSDAS